MTTTSSDNSPLFPPAEQLAGLPPDGGPDFNRLIFSKSPYLLQHAKNPVDWYPWCSEAFRAAETRDCPILLSIGYSTCHWCHVMAHESFESEEIAMLVNRHFVAIKVDREERPDIDATYMAACQLMTGGGGWPLTLLLTPDRQPFFAATYLPPVARGGQVGLTDLLEKVAGMWQNNRDQLLLGATRVTDAIRRLDNGQTAPATPDEALLAAALDQYRADFDRDFAGFGPPPKFPAPHNLELLLRLERRFGTGDAADMAVRTLAAIRTGGIYDQLGFGMHRYSVDRHWLVPHFEKMLYDQALLILAACSSTRGDESGLAPRLASETADYLLRELRHPAGGFYCGEDADSEGAEGTFYLWDADQVRACLPTTLAAKALRIFRITDRGNFEGRNILTLDPAAMDDPDLEAVRTTLLKIRERRPRPHRDEKILTCWNGLAIAALARAGATCQRPELVEAAGQAAHFILEHLRRPDGRLLRRYCDGEADIPGFLEDYAFLGFGLFELYQAGHDSRWLLEARRLAAGMLDLFGDGQGGLYDTGHDAEMVLTRGRSLQDGALPSGISVASGLLLRLGRLTGESNLQKASEVLLKKHLQQAKRYPRAYSWLLATLDSWLDPEPTLVLVPGNGDDGEAWLRQVRDQATMDFDALIAGDALYTEKLPALEGRFSLDGRTTAWLCHKGTCYPPTTDSGQLCQWLGSNIQKNNASQEE
ncbi:MAG: thioredoxin domain-containing protein [Deltaproteobacteria bacterium]|nr:MAG: thioredoxin domain-containing protein [Deltaproteobacteria bacterium]